MNEYPFTEMLPERLNERLAELKELQQFAHGEQRATAIGREVMHLIFELNSRRAEASIFSEPGVV